MSCKPLLTFLSTFLPRLVFFVNKDSCVAKAKYLLTVGGSTNTSEETTGIVKTMRQNYALQVLLQNRFCQCMSFQ